MNPNVQRTSEGMPFAVPEIELKRGEIILAEGPGFNLIGMSDRDGHPTYIPTFLKVVNTETGELNPSLRKFGIDKVVQRWKIPEGMVENIMEASKVMPLILAVDREVNHSKEDDLSDYPIPSDGFPVEWVGVAAPPWAGKTRLIVEMLRLAEAEGTTKHVYAEDLDDLSSGSLTQTLEWIGEEVEAGRLDPGDELVFFDKVEERTRETAKIKREIHKPNLRDLLAEKREKYKTIGPDYVWCQEFYNRGEVMRKKMILVDLPGIQHNNGVITEKRPLDLLDCLFLAMPTVELPKVNESLPFFGPSILRTVFDERVDQRMKEWIQIKERVRALVETKPLRFSDEEICKRVDRMNLRTSNNTMRDLLGDAYQYS